MRDWLMENGERTCVSGGFAYDTDNDAWCELGSTEGSTPVWWRKYERGRSGGQGRELSDEQKAELDRLKSVVASYDSQLEGRRAELTQAEARYRRAGSGSRKWLAALSYAIALCAVFGPILAQHGDPMDEIGYTLATTSLGGLVWVAVVVAVPTVLVYAVLSWLLGLRESSLGRRAESVRESIAGIEEKRNEALDAAEAIWRGYVK